MGYRLFSYALQPAKRTSTSFMGASLEEYLVQEALALAINIEILMTENSY